MAITPEFDAFAQGYAKGENQVIYTRLQEEEAEGQEETLMGRSGWRRLPAQAG